MPRMYYCYTKAIQVYNTDGKSNGVRSGVTKQISSASTQCDNESTMFTDQYTHLVKGSLPFFSLGIYCSLFGTYFFITRYIFFTGGVMVELHRNDTRICSIRHVLIEGKLAITS